MAEGSVTGEFCTECFGSNIGCLDCAARRSLGFTQEDLEALGSASVEFQGSGREAEQSRLEAAFARLYEKVAALLRPEEPMTGTTTHGFTREDVDKLRGLALHQRAEASQWANGPMAEWAPRFAGGHQARHEELAAWADSLADRLAALPPQEGA